MTTREPSPISSAAAASATSFSAGPRGARFDQLVVARLAAACYLARVIESATFRNFRALKSVDLNFRPLTVLVGPNGVGKSTVLQGIERLARLNDVSLGRQFPDAAMFPRDILRWRSRGAREPFHLSIKGERSPTKYSVSLTVDLPDAKDDDLHPQVKASLSVTCGKKEVTADPEKSINGNLSLLLPEIGPVVDRTQIYRLDPLQIAGAAPGARPGYLGEDGLGVAEALRDLKLEDEEIYEEILDSLRRIVPRLRGIRFEKVPARAGGWGHGLVIDMMDVGGIPGSAVSGGTLIALGILVAVRQPEHPSVILLDELEHGLHPTALGALVDVLHDMLDGQSGLQIIATSHSPYLLDFLDPDEIRLGTIGDDGFSTFAPLKSHPEFSKWASVMKPGEFWSTVGEKWIVGEKQVPYKPGSPRKLKPPTEKPKRKATKSKR